MNPDDRAYHREHTWALANRPNAVTVGITRYAADQLGDIVYVDLRPTGTVVNESQEFGEVESTKTVSDLISPVHGQIVEVNQAVVDRPELLNEDPWQAGWLVVLEVVEGISLDHLLTAQAYADLVGET